MSIVESPVRTAARTAFDRQPVTILELDLDRCLNTFSVLPCTATGTPCYNTFWTCKDTPNFNLGSKTYRFINRGAPIPIGETLRPYLISAATAPTEIDPEAGLARRASVSVILQDEVTSDVEQDPYTGQRTVPAGSTFLARLIARNPNYSGRWARIRRGYALNPWDWNAFQDELYIIDQIDGPDATGRVRITLKDPLKLSDRDQLPVESTGSLAAGITASDVSVLLGAGEGPQYDGDDYFRIGSEIIKKASRTGDTLTGLARGQFGTKADSHSSGAQVQKNRTWINTPITQVIHDILNETGISDTYIDVAQLNLQEATWLGNSYNITATRSRPESGSRMLAELAILANGSIWWQAIEKLVKFKVIAGEPPSSSLAKWTDETFMDGTTRIISVDALRKTRISINYDLINSTEDSDDAKNFHRSRLQIDVDAEGPNEYNDRRVDNLYSSWFTQANDGAVLALAGRKLTRYRDPPKRLSGRIDPKDFTEGPGALVEVQVGQLVDKNGNPKTTRCLLRRVEDKGDHIAVQLETTILGNRRGFIAPAGTPDYPTDSVYAHIANASGLMTDGTDGWVIQ